MDDQLSPRPDHLRDPESIRRWQQMENRDYGSVTAVAVVVIALFAGLLLFSVWGGTDQRNTQVGQNVERNQTPDLPRSPSIPK